MTDDSRKPTSDTQEGDAAPASDAETSLATSLHAAATRFPTKIGIIFGDRALSYVEFDLEARRIALRLIAAGVGSGDRVALHMWNGSDLALAYFACFYAGAIAVPINTRLKALEIEFLLTHSGASLYLGQAELIQETKDIRQRCPGVRQFATHWDKFEIHADRSAPGILPAIVVDQPAAILYTTGTTARPKGVVHTHRSLLIAARRFCIQPDDIATIITPMVHAAGFMTFLDCVRTAATAVLIERFDPDVVLDAIEHHRATYLFGMPVMYRALVAAQTARPRDVRSGAVYLASGDAIPLALKSEFVKHFDRMLHEVFATTETGLIAINWSSTDLHADSCGCVLPGIDIDIVDSDGNPERIEAVGELIVRSESNLAGYWNDLAATQSALRDGWFHTGDLIRRLPQDYLHFEGRKKEIIVRGGSNISPQEVEAVLYQHASVREAGVIGVPDTTLGQRVIAYVSRRPDHEVTAAELIAFVAERLADYKAPEEILFLDDLPKSPVGKILRRTLEEMDRRRCH